MGDEVLHRSHDLRHTGLVVRAQQSGSVSNDEAFARVARQNGKVGRPHDDVLRLVEDDVAAGIGDLAGLHVFTGGIGGGVHVGDQTIGLVVLMARRGAQMAIDPAELVHHSVADPQLLQLLAQGMGQHQLIFGTRNGLGTLIGGGGKRNIVQKTVDYIHFKNPLYKSS